MKSLSVTPLEVSAAKTNGGTEKESEHADVSVDIKVGSQANCLFSLRLVECLTRFASFCSGTKNISGILHFAELI